MDFKIHGPFDEKINYILPAQLTNDRRFEYRYLIRKLFMLGFITFEIKITFRIGNLNL